MRDVLGVLAGCAVLAAAGAAASPGPRLTGPGTIRITGREVDDTRVDVGKRGRTPGDAEIIREQLFNTRITPRTIGHSEMVCTFTVRSSRNCSGTYFLPKGKIVVAGPIYYRQLYELAVVGGTGLYDN